MAAVAKGTRTEAIEVRIATIPNESVVHMPGYRDKFQYKTILYTRVSPEQALRMSIVSRSQASAPSLPDKAFR